MKFLLKFQRNKVFFSFFILILGVLASISKTMASPSSDSSSVASQNNKKEHKKTYKIYMILFNGKGDLERGFTSYLRKQDFAVEYIVRDCKGHVATCPIKDFINEIRTLKPDLVYSWATPITQIVVGRNGKVNSQDHITDIPVLCIPIADPVSAGFTSALNTYTGRNIFGVSQMMPINEQINAIRQYAPFKKIGAIYTPFEDNIIGFIRALEKAAKEQGFEFVSFPIPLKKEKQLDGEKIKPLLEKIAAENVDFLYMGPDSAILDFAPLISEEVKRLKIATFGTSSLTIQKLNPLYGFYSSFFFIGQLGADMAMQILNNKDNKSKEELYQFRTLFTMSQTLNIDQVLATEKYPPLSLLKVAHVTHDVVNEPSKTKEESISSKK